MKWSLVLIMVCAGLDAGAGAEAQSGVQDTLATPPGVVQPVPAPAVTESLSNDPIADETVRYVNDQVISLGDVNRRTRDRILANKTRPINSKDDLLVERRKSLEELTDEEVLIQFAKQTAEEHKIPLIDHERVSQMVNDRARASGRNMSYADQAVTRKAIERRQEIDFCLSFFEGKGINVAPELLLKTYQGRRLQYYVPAQATLLEILLRPSDASERDEIHSSELKLFQEAQDARDAAVKLAATSRLDAYIAANPHDQDQILLAVVKTLAAQAPRTDLDAASGELAKRARQTLARSAGLRDATMAFAQLVKIRADLVGKDDAAFRQEARSKSQGPGASQGGERSKIEQGSEGPVFDSMVFTLKAGEMSQVFRLNDDACLVKVTQIDPARYKDFSEVAGEIESELRRKMEDAIRARAIAMLRSKACIRNVVDLSERNG